MMAIVSLALIIAEDAYGVHKGAGDLVCGNCHTMHNSQGNVNMEGGVAGSFSLLRGNVNSRAEVHKLCLQCHGSNGAQARVSHGPKNVIAPKVYSTASWSYEFDGFGKIGAGGNFYPELNNNWDTTTSDFLGYGHSLGATNVLPPGGDSVITEFSCTNCHDPHGTNDPDDPDVNIFRNLRVRPIGMGANGAGITVKFYTGPNYDPEPDGNLLRQMRSYVGSVSFDNPPYFGGNEKDNNGEVIWPIFRGSLTGDPAIDRYNSNSYGSWRGSVHNTPTMSDWCLTCHDDWKKIGTFQRPYRHAWGAKRHPYETIIPTGAARGCEGGCHPGPYSLDRRSYTADIIRTGKGVPVTSGGYHWRSNDRSAHLVYYLHPFNGREAGMDIPWPHRVSCLTCHFAHGGPYYDAMRWDYNASIDPEQWGNPIPNNVGCELCHGNR